MICLLTKCNSGDHIKKDEVDRAFGMYVFEERVLVGKPEGQRLLGRPRRRCEVNVRFDLPEIVCGGVDCNDLAVERGRWRAVVIAVMNIRIP
jgi:hypothetical protein